MSKDSVACSQANLLQVCYWSSPPPPIAFTIVPFSWRACSSLACVYKIVYLANPYFLCACFAGQNKRKIQYIYREINVTQTDYKGPFEDGSPSTWLHSSIYLSEWFGFFCVPETFHAKFPVLVKSVFKIVPCALPLKPTPNHPATSKLRDRRRIYLFFSAKGELRRRAKREYFPRALCETTQQTNWTVENIRDCMRNILLRSANAK